MCSVSTNEARRQEALHLLQAREGRWKPPEELELELAASWGSGMEMGMELELERDAGERKPI